MTITEAELYQIIGELYVARALTDRELKQVYAQVSEMSVVIAQLREENGKLVESNNNDKL